jgi:hypothetical protein
MENTLNGATAAPANEQSAVQNTKGAGSTLMLVLLWLAVSIPMLWGIVKAFDDVQAVLP